MEFNERLRELRKRSGLTQEELSAKLYVSRTAVSKWESGRGYPSIDSLKAIAEAFSVTVDELISSGEALTIAEEEKTSAGIRLRDLIFGLIDISALLFLLLPLFAERSGGIAVAVTLVYLTGIAPYMKAAYLAVIAATAVCGISVLALRNCTLPVWIKIKRTLSLSLSLAAVLIFILSLQPYAAVLSLFLMLIKAVMLAIRK